MSCGRLEVRDGFLVLIAALWFVDEAGVMPLFLLAAAVHEGGHLLVLYLSGGRLHRLTLTLCGAVIRCTLPEGRCARAAVCLAGPAAGFVLAPGAMKGGLFTLAGASVLLGAFNLLPMQPLDGGMALYHLADGGLVLLRGLFGAGTALLLFGGGAWLAWQGGGIWLLLIGALTAGQEGKTLAKSRNRV